MKKTIVTVFLVVILSMTVLQTADTDGSTTITARWSEATLMHASVECIYDTSISYNDVWSYERGDDSAMKYYIENYRTASAPVSKVTHFESGKYYEIYYIEDHVYPLRDFNVLSGPEKALNPFTYDINVDKRSQITLTLNSSPTGYLYIRDIYGSESRTYVHLEIGESAKLDYPGDGHYLTLSGYHDTLFNEVMITMDVKTFTGSPALYMALATAVVILVGATVFICGRKPKL